MSLYDFFHSFFGNYHRGNVRPPEFEGDHNFGFNKPDVPHWKPGFEADDDMKEFPSVFDHFEKLVMTDPFEMHQFFEQKINEMMKSFMSPEALPGYQGFGVFESPEVPALTEKQDPRDHYLKPGVKPRERDADEKSGDTTKWLDKFLPSSGQDSKPTQPRMFSSFKSVIRKTVTMPDGTTKTEEIIRNSDGSEDRSESLSGADGSSPLLPDTPFVVPDFSGVFEPPKMPEYRDPRYQFLKPGYEKLNPHGRKVDTDLDKQIEEVGIDSLPSFTREPEVPQINMNGTFKSVTRRIVTLPNGVVESEEVIRNVDGTEQRTVTHTWPDGTTKSVTVPPTETSLRDSNKDTLMQGYDKPLLSFALRGVKDFIEILFK